MSESAPEEPMTATKLRAMVDEFGELCVKTALRGIHGEHTPEAIAAFHAAQKKINDAISAVFEERDILKKFEATVSGETIV